MGGTLDQLHTFDWRRLCINNYLFPLKLKFGYYIIVLLQNSNNWLVGESIIEMRCTSCFEFIVDRERADVCIKGKGALPQ